MPESTPHTHCALRRCRRQRGAAGARRAAVRAGTVAVRALRRLIDTGIAAGIGRDVLLEAACITDADLHDADAHLPLAAEIAMWQTLAQHICDPACGIRSGAALRINQLGLLG